MPSLCVPPTTEARQLKAPANSIIVAVNKDGLDDLECSFIIKIKLVKASAVGERHNSGNCIVCSFIMPTKKKLTL